MRVVPYTTQMLDAGRQSEIRGSFYVSNVLPGFSGIAFRLSRVGNPGAFAVKFGSHPGEADIGEARISANDVRTAGDSWYSARLRLPVKLNPARDYYFEIGAESGHAPQDGYLVYGPSPLGGADYPSSFSVSFRVLGKDER